MDFVISGSYGSYKINYIGYVLYAVGATSLIFQGNGLEKIEGSVVDILPFYKHIRDRLRNYMSILEFKSIINAFDQYPIDLHLYDGSILGSIIRPITFKNEPNFDLKKEIEKYCAPILQKNLKSRSKIKLDSPYLYKSLENYFEDNTLEEMKIHLDKLENIISAYELLKSNKNIIAISKTSYSNHIFNSNIPDIAIFDKFYKSQGYSEPLHFKISEAKGSLSIYDEFFKNLDFTVFYVRLEDYKNVIKFEVPYKLSKSDLRELLVMIKTISVDGYPYLLKKAHNNVVIKYSDMERISKMLGLYDKNPRGML